MEFFPHLPLAEICALLFLLATAFLTASIVGNAVALYQTEASRQHLSYDFRAVGFVKFLRRRAQTGIKIFWILLPIVFYEHLMQALLATLFALTIVLVDMVARQRRRYAFTNFGVLQVVIFIVLDWMFYDVKGYQAMAGTPSIGFGLFAVGIGCLALAAVWCNSYVQARMDYYAWRD